MNDATYRAVSYFSLLLLLIKVVKYGLEDKTESLRTTERHAPKNDDKATFAVVSINIAIEGDSTVLPTISSLDDVRLALARIASDAQTEECLLSAEILWAPEAAGDTLTENDIYADYPELIPL
jgi:uncharacterized membrane protein